MDVIVDLTSATRSYTWPDFASIAIIEQLNGGLDQLVRQFSYLSTSKLYVRLKGLKEGIEEELRRLQDASSGKIDFETQLRIQTILVYGERIEKLIAGSR